jgi:hypothetical protein
MASAMSWITPLNLSLFGVEIWTTSRDGYQVSNLGHVRGVDRVIVRKNGSRNKSVDVAQPIPGRTLALTKDSGGYWCAGYRLGRVHVLMAEAFLGPRPSPKHGVLHADDNKDHNLLFNLRYGTQTDNLNDAQRNGKHPTGSKKRCKRDHDLTDPANVYRIPSSGSRQCRQCRKEGRR